MQLEVGDMILWGEGNIEGEEPDIGWVIHEETRINPVEPREKKQMVVVRWLADDCDENHWTEWLIEKEVTIVKGGNND